MGVCLTVNEIIRNGFVADASSETVDHTTLGRLPSGSAIHLERAVPAGGRMGGHFVTGHIDCVGRIIERKQNGEAIDLTISHGDCLTLFLARKGSAAVDGVSLTVNEVDDRAFRVTVVPFTQRNTLFMNASLGTEVNLEADILARYVACCLGVTQPRQKNGDQLLSKLASSGFL